MTIGAYRATADPYYLNAAKIILKRVLERQTADGAWQRAGLAECRCQGNRCRLNSVFCVSIMMICLRMLHEETDDPRVLESLVKAADFMKTMWVEETKLFRYISCRSGDSGQNWTKTFLFDPLVYVHRHTRDPQLEYIIRHGMLRCLAEGFSDQGKTLTQQTRSMPYILYEMDREAKRQR